MDGGRLAGRAQGRPGRRGGRVGLRGGRGLGRRGGTQAAASTFGFFAHDAEPTAARPTQNTSVGLGIRCQPNAVDARWTAPGVISWTVPAAARADNEVAPR